jgi:hypothetical protein
MSAQLDLKKEGQEAVQREVLELGATHEIYGSPYDREVEKRLVRKLDLHFVSLLFVLCTSPAHVLNCRRETYYYTDMLSFLDRSNIGNANAAHMSEDLGMSDSQYQWLLTIFYIAYIVFEWMVLLWKILPPHIYAASCIFLWGLVSMMQGVAQGWRGMMALRFLLGVAEAGFGPGVPFFMSFFYLREELGKRIGTDSFLFLNHPSLS